MEIRTYSSSGSRTDKLELCIRLRQQLLLKSRSTLFMNVSEYFAFTNFSLIILVSFPKFYEILFDLLKSSLMVFRLYLLGTHDDHGVSVWFLF